MKTIKLNTILALVTIGLFFSSCQKEIVPSGNLTTVQHNISDYQNLDISGIIKATVQFSSTEESVKIEADDNLQEFILVEKKGGRLVIRLKDKLNIQGIPTINASITTKEISSFIASGAAEVNLSNQLVVDNVLLDLSGASVFSGSINAQSIASDLSGASSVNLTGASNDFAIDASGASNIGSYDFVTQTITAELSGASTISLSVMDEISIEASGASTLNYKGAPSILMQELTGASSLNQIQ